MINIDLIAAVESGNIHYNHVYVIESVANERDRTGYHLHNDLIRHRAYQLNLASQYLYTGTRSEFLLAFEEIRNQVVSSRTLPLIHVEVHGSKKGLHLASGEIITWFEFNDLCRAINVQTANNLSVTLAACFANYILGYINYEERAPFCLVIAPHDAIDRQTYEHGYLAFYDEVLTTGRLDTAIDQLELDNDSLRFHYFDSKQIFDYLWAWNQDKLRNPDIVKERTEELMDAFLKGSPHFPSYMLPQLWHRIEMDVRGVRNEEEALEYFEMRDSSYYENIVWLKQP